jgi:putative membrane protein
MMVRTTKLVRLMAAVAAVAAIACAKGDDTADTLAAHDTSMGAMHDTSGATATLTNENIFAVLDAANMQDSVAGALAARKGTDTQVKEFGRMMVRDHGALRKRGLDLAQQLNVTPQPPTTDTSARAHEATMARLNSMAAGRNWDRSYIDHEVQMHEQVLATAQHALVSATNQDLQALIRQATPNIQAHLDRAREIQQRLGGTGDSARGTKTP